MSIDIVWQLLFLILHNVKINYVSNHINWRLYITAKLLPTIRQVELIKTKEFTTAAFNLKDKVFIVHIGSIS